MISFKQNETSLASLDMEPHTEVHYFNFTKYQSQQMSLYSIFMIMTAIKATAKQKCAIFHFSINSSQVYVEPLIPCNRV